MNSIEVTVYQCEKCHKHWVLSYKADECCKDKPEAVARTCRECGCKVESYQLICATCLNQKRFTEAKKVKYSEYEAGYLWDENKDEYFRDKEALEDKYDDDATDDGTVLEYPTWCYGCTETFFSIDIDSAIENAMEDMYEDFNDIEDEKGLQDFIKEWNAKQAGKTYGFDYKTVVLLNE